MKEAPLGVSLRYSVPASGSVVNVMGKVTIPP